MNNKVFEEQIINFSSDVASKLLCLFTFSDQEEKVKDDTRKADIEKCQIFKQNIFFSFGRIKTKFIILDYRN